MNTTLCRTQIYAIYKLDTVRGLLVYKNNTLHTMKTQKKTERESATNKLVKTDRQTESAFIVFSCIIVAGILLIVTVIMENL